MGAALDMNTLLCPSCGAENTADSRFCRQCGTALEGAAPAAPLSPNDDGAAPVAATRGENGADPVAEPSEIDARRALQLLDRALFLSERGNAASAILACRQSIALAPRAAGGYAMLGLLLERSGDLNGAIGAYEKGVQLAPGDAIERESLDRLREQMRARQQPGTDATMFHFDDAELFGESELPAPAPRPETLPIAAPPLAAPPEPGLPNIGATAPGLPPAFTPPRPQKPAPRVERRQVQRRQMTVPVSIEQRVGRERRAAVRGAAGLVPASSSALAAGAAAAPRLEPPRRGWERLWTRPSFYGRSLPLVAATVLALGFLSWARSWAVARDAERQASAAITVENVDAAPLSDAAPVGIASNAGVAPPAIGNAAPNGGFPISNRAVPVPPSGAASQTANSGAAPGAATTGAASLPARPAPRALNGGAAAGTTAPSASGNPVRPRVAGRLQLPFPVPSSARSGAVGDRASSASNDSAATNGVPLLPAPQIEAPDPGPTPVVVGGTTPALNPAGSGGRGYVRITQGRVGTSTVPARSSAQASAQERNAANAARTGQSERAINSLSNAINSDSSDAGFRFQQRATLFLQNGDYRRAADDFQSAISAYNDQINSGESVASARAGLRAARSGLNLALAGGRSQ